MIKAYYLDLEGCKWTKREQKALASLSDERAAAIMNYKKESGRLLSLYSALLANKAFFDLLHIPADRLKFSYGTNRRPHLVYPADTGLDFNYSHTESAVLFALTDESFIGTDIESSARRIPANIYAKVFHPDEINYINSSGKSKEERFFECWTRKEAYTKQLGTGLSRNLSSINTLSDVMSSTMLTIRINKYICSICVSRPSKSLASLKINHISKTSLVK